MMAAATRSWDLSALLAGMAAVNDQQDVSVTGLSLDSRSVQPGDLFLACAGTRQHGLLHARQAIDRGAAAIAWEACVDHEPAPDINVPAVAVEALGQKVGLIADRFFAHPSGAMTVIGITGTDGKTSISHFLAQALDQESAPCGVLGTLGYGLYGQLEPATHTTPDGVTLQGTIQRLRELGARWLAMEVSSHALEQGRVNGVAFDFAVFTNLSRDHLDYHGTMEIYGETKRRLFEWPGLDYAIINLDDAFGRKLSQSLPPHVRLLGYGMQAADRYDAEAVLASELKLDRNGLRATVVTPWAEGELEARVLGRFNVMNLLAVLATLLAIGIELPDALVRLRSTRTVPGRMEPFDLPGRPLVVVDYAHTPAALENALRALREHCEGELWCVFGCGGDRDRGKRPLMAKVVERYADRVVVTDDNPRGEDPRGIVEEILQGFDTPDRVDVEHDRARAIAAAIERAAANDVVLVAGKGHETVQLVGDEQRPFSDREQVRAVLAGGRA